MRPNIILLMADQQRSDTLGCYGNTFVSTPNIDRMASEGARFDNCFTPYPVCTPARATMWTGVYPHKHQVVRNVYSGTNIPDVVNEQKTLFYTNVTDALSQVSKYKETVFDLVRGSGYMTAYFGKWHLGEDDPGMFDVWEGFNSLGGHWVEGVQGGEYKPDAQTDRMIEFMKEQAEAGKPFFAVNGYYPPHDPFAAPKRFYEYYRNKGVPFAGYYAAVSALDYNVGRIMDALDELGLAENTILVYYSDHGETFNYREDSEHKFVCHEEAIRVPLVVRWPARIKPDQVYDCITGLEDLMPTILECTGVDLPDYLDGRSLVPWFDGESVPWREDYYVQNKTRYGEYEQRCIRTNTWKLILSNGGPDALFNLEDDPEEELNVYEAPRQEPHNRFAHFSPFTDTIIDLAHRLRQHAEHLEDSLGCDLADRAVREMEKRKAKAVSGRDG